MNKKSFFLGFVAGTILTFAIILVIGIVKQNTEESDPINYLEQPVSYENKSEASFKVFQVLGNAALASESDDNELKLFLGNTVLILGDNFYSGQVITIKEPQRIGTYDYTTQNGIPKTVPVIDGTITE